MQVASPQQPFTIEFIELGEVATPGYNSKDKNFHHIVRHIPVLHTAYGTVPAEIFKKIFRDLDTLQLLRLMRVCRSFRRIILGEPTFAKEIHEFKIELYNRRAGKFQEKVPNEVEVDREILFEKERSALDELTQVRGSLQPMPPTTAPPIVDEKLSLLNREIQVLHDYEKQRSCRLWTTSCIKKTPIWCYFAFVAGAIIVSAITGTLWKRQ